MSEGSSSSARGSVAETNGVLHAVRAILPIVRAEAHACETAGRMTAPVLEAFFELGLFKLLVPRALGGREADLPTALAVFEAVAEADGAAGWTVMIGAGAGFFAGFMQRSAAEEIFRDPRAVVAGSGAPTGVARPCDGGYVVTGRWAYASGAHHASWFTANCVVEGAAPGAGARGAPVIRSIAVPAADVRIHATWDVVGMRGTGSEDFSVADVLVPAARTFYVLSDAPAAPGPLYRLPFFALAELSFAAVALGIARHALDDFAALANGKRPLGAADVLARDADVQARFARAEAAVRAARAFVYDTAADAWERVARGADVPDEQRALIQLAAVDAVHRSGEAVDLLYARAGMTPLLAASALGRAWRDVHAVSQNAVVSAGLYSAAGATLIARGRSNTAKSCSTPEPPRAPS